MIDSSPKCLNRRNAITLGLTVSGGFAGAIVAGCSSPSKVLSGDVLPGGNGASQSSLQRGASSLGVDAAMPFPQNLAEQIEDIVGAQGTISNGVFSIEIDRNDITDVTLHGFPILPANQINGTLFFQYMGGGRVFMNSDMCMKAREINSFIDQLLSHDIAFQAEHQHFYDFAPLVWFIHFRAGGDALQLARGVKAALNVTSTPFPQMLPKNPTTPLPAEALGDIIGAKPSIGSNGIVNFLVPRANPITLGGVSINPYLNVATSIAFQPCGGGQNAIAIPDYGMIPPEIGKVVGYNRARSWDIGCLYNQETDEMPQLFFSHEFKQGDSIQLAREIRGALNLMDMKFSPP